jgi:hypothetical protein
MTTDEQTMAVKAMRNQYARAIHAHVYHCARGRAENCGYLTEVILRMNMQLHQRLGDDYSVAPTGLGKAEVDFPDFPELGDALLDEPQRFPYAHVGFLVAVVAVVAFYVGRRTRNDAYQSL